MYWNSDIFLILSALVWLTLTWDVLKLISEARKKAVKAWLTLTWDVLKSDLANGILYAYAININMRCIEIFHMNH